MAAAAAAAGPKPGAGSGKAGGKVGGAEAPEGRWACGADKQVEALAVAGLPRLGGLGVGAPRVALARPRKTPPPAAAADSSAENGAGPRSGPSPGAAGELVLCTAGDVLSIMAAEEGAGTLAALRTLNNITFGGGVAPTCLAHTPAEDAPDLLVGLSSGEVLLAALGDQVADAGGKRLVGATSFNKENPSGARCVCVAWSPLTPGLFSVALSDGSVLMYQRPLVEDGPSNCRDTGMFGRGKPAEKVGGAPTVRWQIGFAPVEAMAFAPDGRRLGTCGRDGVFRLFDVESGTLVGGCTSYYGAFLCLAWSPDGRFVALGGEDDLVCVYSVADRCVVIWGEGHGSWVTGVAWDRHWQPPRKVFGATELGASGGGYRLVSVGQDTQVLWWDFEPPESVPEHRRAPSLSQSPLPLVKGPPSPAPKASATKPKHRRGTPSATSGASSGGGFGSNVSLEAGVGAVEAAAALSFTGLSDPIAPSVARAEMVWMSPLAQSKCHDEPICAVAVSARALWTVCAGPRLRMWWRP